MPAGTLMTIRALCRERQKNIMRVVVGKMIANAKLTKFSVSIKMIKEKMCLKSKH